MANDYDDDCRPRRPWHRDDDDEPPRRRRDEDDYDDDYDRKPPYPGTVRAAGVIWVGVGILSLINMLFVFAAAGANQGAGGKQANPNQAAFNAGQSVGGCCGGLIGVVFIFVGYQSVVGTAKDVWGNAIGSFCFGGLQLVLGLAIGSGAVKDPNMQGQREVALFTGLIVGMVGMVLIAAGIMALVGREAYLEWRAAYHPTRRRRRRRRDDDWDD